jgi:hypothetical protein
MAPTPDRILRERHITCMAALDTMPHIVTRVQNLLAHGRRITTTQRYTYVDQPPEVTAGLTVDRVNPWTQKNGNTGIAVHLNPGLTAGFGVGAYAGENDTEAGEWKKYHAAASISDDPFKRRRDMTRVTITGGLPDDGPARDDQLIIRAWNRDGVCQETVVAFDCGPRDARDRLARWLYLQASGTDRDTTAYWDTAQVSDGTRQRYYDQADAALAAIAGTEH